MSPSVFEIVELPMKDIIEQKPELYEECLKTLSQQSGLKNQWYAGAIEEPRVYYDFLEWGSYEDHENFMKSPIYHPFGDSLKALLSGEWAFCHVPLDPVSTNAFKGPVVSYRTVTLKPGLDRQKVTDVLNKAIMDTGRTFSKCNGVGWGFTREDENKVVIIASWDSKEAWK